MAGLEFKTASNGGYFTREKEPLKFDRTREPIDSNHRQEERDEKFEQPYVR